MKDRKVAQSGSRDDLMVWQQSTIQAGGHQVIELGIAWELTGKENKRTCPL